MNNEEENHKQVVAMFERLAKLELIEPADIPEHVRDSNSLPPGIDIYCINALGLDVLTDLLSIFYNYEARNFMSAGAGIAGIMAGIVMQSMSESADTMAHGLALIKQAGIVLHIGTPPKETLSPHPGYI